ncbi:alcohol dehydrogenase [Novosphingobium sp. PC22D]|uniref:aldo/keto reductase n=1 Tax=Novosphingobium sp. PC22D TaxID=1962403 RepID=UPI000BF030C9|nr:aldo/keto reductase [Novosphingobium sp. PC22D]PEQ11130.1 alcohol dehydrogenase [Novosphingobium sp. PC22D]
MADRHPGIGGLPLVLGGNVFGWTLDRDGGFAVLDAFYEAGGRMIDSAEGYSAWAPGNVGGESEAMLGDWMESRGVRGDMLIGTKTGMGGVANALAPEKVTAALEGSLERLRTDYVDIYYVHRDDKTTPLDEVASVFGSAVVKGKARELGVSNYAAARLRALNGEAERQSLPRFSVMQPMYNLVARSGFEGELQALSVEQGIAALPYYGLASGFLTGKYASADDWQGSSRAGALDAAAADGGWNALAVLQDVAARNGVTCAQVALAWLRRQPGVAAPIASATSPAQVSDLVRSATIELAKADLAKLDGALP